MLQHIILMAEMLKARAALQQQVGTVKSIIIEDEGAGRINASICGQNTYMTVYDAFGCPVSDAKEIAYNAITVYEYYNGKTAMRGVEDEHLMHLTWNGGDMKFEFIYG